MSRRTESEVTKRPPGSPPPAIPNPAGSSSLKCVRWKFKRRLAEIDYRVECGGLPPHYGQNSIQKLFRTEWFCEVRLKTDASRALPVRVS
jgi:hypothetical protein